MSKKIVLTGGGSAGHVTPHLALIPHLMAQGYEIYYIGTKSGIERGMMENMPGIKYYSIQSGKLRRYFSIKNFTDPFRVIAGAFQAIGLMRRLKPDVCFSKGGFVSVPVVFGAYINKIPVVCHESDITPGLANKICARFAKKVAVTFPECAQAIGPKAVLTGTPLRPELFSGSPDRGLAYTGFSGEKPILLMTGGSQGAQSINNILREALPELLSFFDIVHLCGKNNLSEGLNNTPGYWQREFVSQELPDVMAAADIVLSRAGSNTLSELQAMKKPMLLIPYPKGASRGDQVLNAKSFCERGLCHILWQEDLNKASLVKSIFDTYEDRNNLVSALKDAPPADGTEKIMDLISQVQSK